MSKGFGEAHHGCLGGRVGMRREEVRGGGKAEYRTHVEDAATLALLAQLLHRGAVGVHQGGEIEIDGLLPTLVGEFVQRSVAPLAATAASDMVEAIELTEL